VVVVFLDVYRNVAFQDLTPFVRSGKTLAEIGAIFKINRYSTVSTAISRVQVSLNQESVVQKMHQKLCQQLKVSQPKT